MNLLTLSLSLALSWPVIAGPPITNLVLNPREIVMVPVATDRLTTFLFPSPPTHIEAAFISTEPEPPARFQLVFQPGHSFFSVRALGTNATASINVIWHTNTYVFELVSSTQPLLALTLVEPVKRNFRDNTQSPSSHRLLGILDTAKAYSILKVQHPDEVSDVKHASRRDRYDFGGYEIVLEDVFHFQTEDTLVFRAMLHNKGATPLYYLPQTFRVKVGQSTLFAAIADGEGTVPPMSRSSVYFAVTTAADGSHHSLALDNEFIVLMTVPAPPEQPTPQPKRSLFRSFKHP